MKVRWQNGAERGSHHVREVEIDAQGLAVEEGVVIFLDAENKPLLIVPQGRLIDAVKASE